MLSEEEIALAYWQGRMRCHGDNKAKELAGRRAIESAATAPLLARIAELEKDCDRFERYWNEAMATHKNIAELERQLEEARKDAEMLDWLDKQNADIENDAWVVLAHDCAGDEDCKKYWVGADLRGAIRAAIKEQT